MVQFLVKRIFQTLVALWGVITLVFIILHFAGDPTLLMLPESATAEDVARLRSQLGFDRPLIVQYLSYMGQLLRFDLGTSYIQNLPVSEIIASRIPYTLTLAFAALLVAIGIGVPVGIIVGLNHGKMIEKILMPIVLIGQSMPTFWSGILLIMLFSIRWGVLPSSGADGAGAVILPAVSLGALSMATFARILRTSIIEEMDKPYVRAARAKGISFGKVFFRHVFRNSSIPLITIAAIELATLLAGAVIVETVFAWPGLGQLAVQAINSRDFSVVQAVVLLGSFVYIILNLIADLLYSIVDPRIKIQEKTS
ncbi:MAG: ABC transporter permease [Spirochaetales bacterium]|nr:ABC transporter permease [Spirochaetales bacterium]